MKFQKLADTFENLESTSKRLEMTDSLAELFKQANEKNITEIIYLLQGRVAPAFEGIEIGIGEKFVEQAIAKATGYSTAEIQKKYQKQGDLGLVAEELVENKKQRSLMQKDLTVNHVYKTFMKMATVSGKGSQDMKIKLLTELLNNSTPKEARYLVRIPLGRLRLVVDWAGSI